MNKLIEAIVLLTLFSTCSNDMDLTDHIKKSDVLIENGIISVAINGTTNQGLSFNEMVEFNFDNNLGSHYHIKNDSVIEYTITRSSLIENKSLTMHITKTNDNYVLTNLIFSVNIKKPDNKLYYIFINAKDESLIQSELKIDTFSLNSGEFLGEGSFIYHRYYNHEIDYNITYKFDVNLIQKISDNNDLRN